MDKRERLRRCARAEQDIAGFLASCDWLKDRLVMLTAREDELDGEAWAREMSAFASAMASASAHFCDILTTLDKLAARKVGLRIDKHAQDVAVAFRLTLLRSPGEVLVPKADGASKSSDVLRRVNSVKPLS